MGVRPNARMLYVFCEANSCRRDMAARQAVQSNELLRRAYKYIARNTTLPSRVRHMAQLELNAFPSKSRPAVVKERCIETGRGRGIFTEFGLCRPFDLA
ncbi:40S ribosomal protein mrp2, mitochondrial [Malassezia caprae]|uniref:40S ribosomal protein mrp2, mitochondrial n=1 Tax=Malassezia caprae TaxID=1381934 RepID=A0AAF0IWF5_9BASI|nr:40S ribosomal protein mrp2, mitochondrial [Malassezia caprae]